MQVAAAVADGKSNAEIAIDLTFTVPTVESYISAIFSKPPPVTVQLALLVQSEKH